MHRFIPIDLRRLPLAQRPATHDRRISFQSRFLRTKGIAPALGCLAALVGAIFGSGAPARAGGPPVPVGGVHPVAQYGYVDLVVESAAYVKGGLQPIIVLPQPLSDAAVNAGGPVSKVAGTTSTFLFSFIPGTSAIATVSCRGYVTQTVTVSNNVPYTTTTQYVFLSTTPPTATYLYAGVTGTVNDTASTGTAVPVANATVSLTVNGGAPLTATTDSSGTYTIPVSGNVPSGAALTISVHGYGYTASSSTPTESGTPSAAGMNYALGTTTLAPNNKAVYCPGSGMGYIYGCCYPSWQSADFAPHYLADWPPPLTDEDGYNYDFDNVETFSGSPHAGTLVTIQQGFTDMGALPKVNGTTPMRVVRWNLFPSIRYTLMWVGDDGHVYPGDCTDPYAHVSSVGANSQTINPATGAKDPLLAGVTSSGLDYTTFQQINLALTYASQNNIRILFNLAAFQDLQPLSVNMYAGNHRAIATATATTASGLALTGANNVQDSFVNYAVKPAIQYITAWENAYGAANPGKSRNIVFAYDTMNEPDQWTDGTINTYVNYTMDGTYNYDPNAAAESNPVAPGDITAYTKRLVSIIHGIGGGALATGDTSAPQAVSLLHGCGLDFYCAHYYMYWNDASNGDYPPDAWNAPGSGLANANIIGVGGSPLDKPCVIEELQTAAENTTAAANPSAYDVPGTTNPFTATSTSANFVLNQVMSKGYAGALGWGYTETYQDNDEHSALGFYMTNFDPLSDWPDFEPFFAVWPTSNSYNPATDAGVTIGPN